VYANHSLNRLPMTIIEGKTPMEIWSGGAACNHGSLRLSGCPAYVDVKKNLLASNTKKLVF